MKTRKPKGDDLRPEYDFASMRGGIRGKYAKRLRQGSNVVILAEDVADAFPDAQAVNEALRALMQASSVMRPAGRPSPAMRRAAGAKRARGR